MRYCLLILCIFLSFFITTCSSNQLEEMDSKKTKIDYLGTSTVDTNTNFTFWVSSDYQKPIAIYVEALTIFNERLISNHFTLKQGEKKEITLQKKDVITSNYYIKSYRIKRYETDALPLQRPLF